MAYLPLDQSLIGIAEAEVLDQFGDAVSVRDKAKGLIKFGRNEVVGTSEATVAGLGSGELHETYVSTNAITHISSDNASDTEEVTIEYHTVSGGVFTFGVQQVTLAGQTKTALPTPAARVSRVFNSDSGELVGAVYVYEDVAVSGGVPTTASAIHATIPAGRQQSFKAATTISNSDYMFITQVVGSVSKKTSATVDFVLQIRRAGGVFREQLPFAVDSGGQASLALPLEPYLIVPKNADIRVAATSSVGSTEVTAAFMGHLALVQ